MKVRWMGVVVVLLLSLLVVLPAVAAPGGPGSELRPQREGRVRRGVRAAGTVVSAGEDSILITNERGERTIYVEGSTRFVIPEVESPGLEDVEVGNFVLAQGEPTEDGLRARVLVVRPAKPARLRGEVESIGSESLALLTVIPSEAAALVGEVLEIEGAMIQVQTRLDQVIAVQTDATTKFYVPGEEGGGLEALQTGDRIQCGGEWETDGTFRAWAVRVPSRRDRVEIGGLILSMEGEGLRLGTRYGIVSVRVTDETRYRSREEPDFGFEDLEQGRRVHVHGLREEEGLLAQEIFSR